MTFYITSPPKNRRVLIKYWPKIYDRTDYVWQRTPDSKIEECFWRQEMVTYVKWNEEKQRRELAQKVEDRWTPWCGHPSISSTESIKIEDIIGWMELPE